MTKYTLPSDRAIALSFACAIGACAIVAIASMTAAIVLVLSELSK